MSTSRIRDSADVRFSAATLMLEIAYSRRFCVAPRPERAVETAVRAVSSVSIAACAFAAVSTVRELPPAAS